MRKEILSERPNLFEPDAYIGFVLQLTGNVSCEQVKNAVYSAYQTNETTMSKIVLTTNGRAFYERTEQSECRVNIAYGKFEKIFADNRKIPFQLKDGELVRTFIIPKDKEMTVLIMAHHLAGDGKAIVRFAEEILEILDGENVPYYYSDILSKEDINQRGALPGIYKLCVKRMNSKWRRVERVFTWDDYQMIHKSYWKNQRGNIQAEWMDQKELSKLKKNAENAGITVNSWLVAKIQENYPQKELIGIPVSVRGTNKSMNNMTSGIRIRHAYNQKKSFVWNARQIHKKIGRMVSNCHMKYLAISFVAEINGSLTDGVLMQEHHLYDNPVTRKMSGIMGYSGKRKTQLGITNLGIIHIPVNHKEYRVEKIFFIPPKVSYADQIIGISIFNNQVCILRNSI